MKANKVRLALAGAVLVVLTGCSVPNIHISVGDHSATPTAPTPAVTPAVQLVTSAQDVADNFPGCGPWEDDSTQYAQVLTSARCQIIIGYDGTPGYGDDKESKLRASGQSAGMYFVNGDTWAAISISEGYASYLANYYGITYETI